MTKFITVQTGVLSNGMKVSYLHLPKVQKLNVMVNVPVGSAHDPKGKEGLSHILEHNVFCGTENMSESELSEMLRMAGGGLDASTNPHRTNFDLWASSQNLDNFRLISDLMRQILTEPTFPHERVEIEKGVILNELGDSLDSFDRGPLDKLDRQIYAGSSPYADTFGTRESIGSVTSSGLKEFMKTNYDAGHMHVYATSPLPFDEAMEVFEQTLSAVPNLGKPRLPAYCFEAKAFDGRLDRPDLNQNYTSLMFLIPTVRNLRERLVQNEAQAHLKSLIPEIIRSKYGCFYAPEVGLWSTSPTNTVTLINMSSTPEDSVVACEALIEFANNIDEHLSDGILKANLDSSAYELSDPDLFTVHRLGDVVAQYELYGGRFNTEESLKTYGSITPDEIRTQAKVIMAGLIGMYVMGPEPHKPPSLEFMQEGLKRALPNNPSVKADFQGPSKPSV